MATFTDVSGVYARRFDPLDQAIELGLASGRLIAVSFVEEPAADAEENHPLLDRIGEYLSGGEETFDDVDVALTLGTDERKALESVRQVPHGESASVSQIVRMSTRDPNDADDVASVKQAIEQNPTPVIIPDHRVKGSDGATPPAVRETLRDIEGI